MRSQPRFPGRHDGARLPAPIAAEQDAQLQEARARMAADGEKPAASGKRSGSFEPRLGSLISGRR